MQMVLLMTGWRTSITTVLIREKVLRNSWRAIADDKLVVMRKVHLVVCDLFLPVDCAAEVCADLPLPALEKMLARGTSTGPSALNAAAGPARTDVSGTPLENHLCKLFGVPCQAGALAPIAPLSAVYDGLGEGCWVRADPVHLRLQRDKLILVPNVVDVSEAQAGQLCAALNRHFAGQGMEFIAPHPQRWYVRVDRLPDIETVPLSQATGRNVYGLLPKGAEALRWHQLFNEIQMLLFSHPVNQVREDCGELSINSLWLWGSGCSSAVTLQSTYGSVSSDELLAQMFASTANISFAGWGEQWRGEEGGRQLLVWTGLRSALQRGDLDAWRAALQGFETGYAQPLWRALRAGEISEMQVDILGANGVRSLSLKRADAWAFWRGSKPLADYSMV